MTSRRASEQDVSTGMATVDMGNSSNQSRTPVPDPTVLGTQQLLREISNLKEFFEARLDEMDKAITLIQASTDKWRDDQKIAVHEAIGNVHSLIVAHLNKFEQVTDQRFLGVSIQFLERDKRTEQLSVADKTAIAAALQAQKEAAGAQNDSNAASVTKQEVAFTKLIDQTHQTQAAQNKSMDDKINALMSRLDRGEGRTKGMGDGWGYIVVGISTLATIVTLIVLLVRTAG